MGTEQNPKTPDSHSASVSSNVPFVHHYTHSKKRNKRNISAAPQSASSDDFNASDSSAVSSPSVSSWAKQKNNDLDAVSANSATTDSTAPAQPISTASSGYAAVNVSSAPAQPTSTSYNDLMRLAIERNNERKNRKNRQ